MRILRDIIWLVVAIDGNFENSKPPHLVPMDDIEIDIYKTN